MSPPSWPTGWAPSSTGRITGVTRFGLFVRLAETGADGLVADLAAWAASTSVHDERAHALVGERTGGRWRLGREVEVRLKEATPITGGLLFEMLSEAGGWRSRRAPPTRTSAAAPADLSARPAPLTTRHACSAARRRPMSADGRTSV